MRVTVMTKGPQAIEVSPIWEASDSPERRLRFAADLGDATVYADLATLEALADAIVHAAAKRRAEIAALAQIGGGNG